MTYDTLLLVIVEAFACGVPVITADHGAAADIVEDGRLGLHFRAGDPNDLAVRGQWAWEHAEQMAEMGRTARQVYEAKYTPERNHAILLSAYQVAMQS